MQMKCSKIEESVCLLDRNLQDYVSNQLKSVWVQVSNLKRRTEDIEEKNNMMNQSFIME